jgi:RNA polymerase sigma-54 factor
MSTPQLTTGLYVRAEQRQLLQPRLLQSIEVLQVPAQDLEGWLLEAAEGNEALQVDPPLASGPAPSREATERHDEMLRNQPDRRRGLAECLLEQVELLELAPEPDRWLRFLVTCVDEHGYLSPNDAELEHLAAKTGMDPDPTSLGLAIAALQRLEPRGIGGRDMVESLLLQLDEDDEDYPRLCRLLEEFLEPLSQNRLPAVARGMGLELEELSELLGRLRGLDPRPGAGLSSVEVPFLRPDLVVEEESLGQWSVRVESTLLPAVSIDADIAGLIKDSETPKDVRAWARERTERARWIVDAVRQRGETLLRVARTVFEWQRPFLESGPGNLRPLTMGEVAQVLDLHLSTVSRAVSGKYVQCPFGILPLRHFFQVATGDGEAPARDDLCAIVRSIFEGEDAREPLSDDAVADELERRGHEVARRTVAKYRKQLGIPSSYRRRKYA